ncbi:transposase [bacterium]|nr:transposase [bacterium]
MVYNPEKHNRKSVRLKGYDYSQPGFYYVTICTQDRTERFGGVSDDEMILNDAGEMVDSEWNRIPERYNHVIIDTYKIKPNHMHGIIVIGCRGVVSAPSMKADKPGGMNGDGAETTPLPTLGQMIARFKYLITKTLNKIDGSPGRRVLQRGFHDHIIRNEEELNRIRKYIEDNPRSWKNDENNPENRKKNDETDNCNGL